MLLLLARKLLAFDGLGLSIHAECLSQSLVQSEGYNMQNHPSNRHHNGNASAAPIRSLSGSWKLLATHPTF